jgi:hypothetical protein
MDDDRSSPPPPRRGDLLFRDDLPDGHNNACLNSSWGDEQVGYTEGYRRGAQLLVQHVVEIGRDQDYLVYPIIFLYRHHIELALKNIILRAPNLIGWQLTDAENGHLGKHRLDLLWQDLKPIFAAICKGAGWQNLDSEDIEGIDDYIRQLSIMDPDSYALRYPRSKKGQRSLPEDVKPINLRHFAELLERLANYLDGLDGAIVSLEDARFEEAERRGEMDDYLDYG